MKDVFENTVDAKTRFDDDSGQSQGRPEDPAHDRPSQSRARCGSACIPFHRRQNILAGRAARAVQRTEAKFADELPSATGVLFSKNIRPSPGGAGGRAVGGSAAAVSAPAHAWYSGRAVGGVRGVGGESPRGR